MGGLLTRLRWGGDPDQIDPDSGLSRRDVYNVKRTWAIMYANRDVYGLQIFLRLFRVDPETKIHFTSIKDMNEQQIRNNVQFKAHIITVMTAINMVVDNLQQPAAVTEILLNKIGHSHRVVQVDRKHFEEIKSVIIGMLRNDLGSGSDVIASWTRFMDLLYKHMLEIYGITN